jgi:hypothetical protein
MHRIIAILAVTTLLSGVGVTRALFAQTPTRPTPGLPDVGSSIKVLAGTVTKIDAVASAVEVSELDGRAGTRVIVTPATQIRIDSRPGELADVHQHAKVSVSYEVHAGTNIATSIDVMPVEASQSDSVTPPAAPSGLTVR